MRCGLCSDEISSFIAAAKKEIDVDYFKRLIMNAIMNERYFEDSFICVQVWKYKSIRILLQLLPFPSPVLPSNNF